MKKKRLNKRGSVEDIVFIVVFVFLLAIAAPVLMLFTSVSQDVVQDDTNIPQNLRDDSTNFEGNFPNLWEGLFLVFFIGAMSTTIIFAFFIDTHPAWFALSLIISIVLMFIAPILSNAYNAMTSTGTLAAYAGEFSVITFIAGNLLGIAIAEFLLVLLAIYAKRFVA